jgi:hypothetical protein
LMRMDCLVSRSTPRQGADATVTIVYTNIVHFSVAKSDKVVDAVS